MCTPEDSDDSAMEPFRIHILGCGAAKPSVNHFPSSQVVEVRGKFIMIDCGEGTQIQLCRYGIHPQKILAVFISHIHGDHCLGLIGMISTFGLEGRAVPLHIYAPAEYAELFSAQLNFFCPHLSFDVVFHSLETTLNAVVYDDSNFSVTTLPLKHSVPCCGFLISEKPTLPHILPNKLALYNIPHAEILNIKKGMPWITDDGRVIPSTELTTPSSIPRRYAYCSDTIYLPSLSRLIDHVNLLYHEATYASDLELKSRQYYHCTARQAAMVARDAHAVKLLLGHYGSRYSTGENVLLSEARAVFPETYLSVEGMVCNVK